MKYIMFCMILVKFKLILNFRNFNGFKFKQIFLHIKQKSFFKVMINLKENVWY